MADKTADDKSNHDVVSFSESGGFDFSVIFVIIAAFVALGSVYYFWSSNKSIDLAIAQKTSEKKQIVDQITSGQYADIEQQVADIKSAITTLKEAKKTNYSQEDFLKELYKKIANDVQITSISISDQTNLTISAATTSFRSVAEQSLALENWAVLSDVKIGAIYKTKDDKGLETTTFSISAKIDTSKPLAPIKETAPATDEVIISE